MAKCRTLDIVVGEERVTFASCDVVWCRGDAQNEPTRHRFYARNSARLRNNFAIDETGT